MKTEYIEKIYAGWLAKTIGIRLGAAIEGWTYENIKNVFGELHNYPTDYKNFAADDDSNGPIFLVRALEDAGHTNINANDIASALLNYAPFEHGFFWWGGYGTSTEHTAYLNLRNGISAPRSGSIEQNGATVAEQIGGQIFSDCWGLVTPGNPEKAAHYAKLASSVTHDGNAIYGGMFVASCISFAFVENDIIAIINKGLSYIPKDCEYARVVNAVVKFYTNDNKKSWRDCYKYILDNFGYDKYCGSCHIIPNTGVMILALLYGDGDFSHTLNICNMCGWDTDCNVGNIATIMGVRCGLEAIDYDKWRKPINDLMITSSVIGSLNIQDIPFGGVYMAKLAYALSGEMPPEPWNTIMNERIHSCHFEFPGSTHAIRVRKNLNPDKAESIDCFIVNTDESAYTGNRSLKVSVKPLDAGDQFYIYQKSYYIPSDFSDSRYDPSFSPTVYPGQKLNGSIFLPEYAQADVMVSMYVHDSRTNENICGESIHLKIGEWINLYFEIPMMKGALLDEIGFCITLLGSQSELGQRGVMASLLIDDLFVTGEPEYTLMFSKEKDEVWHIFHREISQMTRLKGLLYLENGYLHLSCSDFAEVYTGGYDWKNYKAIFIFTPLVGDEHMVNFRVQGGIRSYVIGLLPNNKIALLKNNNGYSVLAEYDFSWNHNNEYIIQVHVCDNLIKWEIDDNKYSFNDLDSPYLYGSIGLSVRNGSHLKCSEISILKS